MAQDKTLKFTMVVDQNSVQQVQNAVKSMISDFDKLTAAIARASQAMGGLMGGGKAGAPQGAAQTIGSSSYHATPGATSTNTSVPGGGAGGGQSMTEAMRQQADAFRTAAAATATAMQSMGSSVTLAHATIMPKLQAMTGQLQLMRGGGGGGQLALPSGGGQPGGPAGAQTINVGGGSGGGGAYTPTPGAASASQAMGGLMGGGAFGGVGVMGIAGIVAAATPVIIASVLNSTKSSMMLGGNLAAERGSAMQNLVMGGLNGDPSSAYFRAMIMKDQTARQVQMKLAYGTADMMAGVPAVGKALIDKVYGWAGAGSGGPGIKDAYNQAVDTSAMGSTAEQIEKLKQAHLMDVWGLGQTMSQLGSSQSIGRRIGSGNKTNAAGQLISDRPGDFMEKSALLGLDPGERLQARQAIAMYGGERAGINFANSALFAGQSGHTGAEKILGMSAAAGQGNFAGAVFGHQNMDFHAADTLGGMLSDRMAGAGRAYDASGAMNALGSASGAFTGGAGDMMAARRAGMGLDVLDKASQGGADGFQMMLNLQAARAALPPGSSPDARQALARMSIDDRMSLANGSRKPSPQEDLLGIGQEEAKKSLGALVYSVANRAQVGERTDKYATIMRAIKSTGGDMNKLQHMGIDQKDLGAALGVAAQTAGWANGAAAEGFGSDAASFLEGNNDRMGKKGGVGDNSGIQEKGKRKADAARQKLVNEYKRTHNPQILQSLIQMGAQAEADALTAGDPHASAVKLITDFETLHQAIAPLIRELNQRYAAKETPKK